jgi:hypothetical protein
MTSLLIFRCPMSHGTMKYTLKVHVCYFVLMVGLLHSLYSMPIFTSLRAPPPYNKFEKLGIISCNVHHTAVVEIGTGPNVR